MFQDQFLEFALIDASGIPLPGSGSTWGRFIGLAEQASRDLSLGRLCEGHADALAILREAEMKPVDGATYGVWASRSPSATTYAERVAGGWRVSGTKEFCSGSLLLQRALVTAVTNEGPLLFDLSLREHVGAVVSNSWPSVGMAASMSETIEFAGAVVPNEYVVGPAGFYLERPGFWFGAVGVAACWFGGAVGLVNGLMRWLNAEPNELVLVELGTCVSELESMRHALQRAARDIDEDPLDEQHHARFLAQVTRQIVHDAALRVLSAVAAAGGARPLCHDGEESRRAADLFVYLSQHHGNADAVELGRVLIGVRSWS